MTLYIDTKPELEWVEDKAPDFFSADTMFGSYCIYHYDRNDDIDVYILRLYDSNCEFGDDLMNDDEPLRPLAEAKAAAQADYERRTAERFKPVEVMKHLEAIIDPVSYIKSTMEDGESINGMVLVTMLEKGHWYQEQAGKAIDNIQSAIDRAKEGK